MMIPGAALPGALASKNNARFARDDWPEWLS
jgi:hypothetical protein